MASDNPRNTFITLPWNGHYAHHPATKFQIHKKTYTNMTSDDPWMTSDDPGNTSKKLILSKFQIHTKVYTIWPWIITYHLILIKNIVIFTYKNLIEVTWYTVPLFDLFIQ